MQIQILVRPKCHDGCIEASMTYRQVHKTAELDFVYLHATTRAAVLVNQELVLA